MPVLADDADYAWLCRKRLRCFTADMWSLPAPPAASSSPAPAQTSPGACTDTCSPTRHPPSNPAAGIQNIEALAGDTCAEHATAVELDTNSGQEQAGSVSGPSGSTSSDSSSSSSEEEYFDEGGSPTPSSCDPHVNDVNSGTVLKCLLYLVLKLIYMYCISLCIYMAPYMCCHKCCSISISI